MQTLRLRPPQVEHRDERFRLPRVVRHVPLAEVRNSTYVLTNGRFNAVFRVSGIEAEIASAREMETFCKGLRNLANALPERVNLRTILRLTPNYRSLFDEHRRTLTGRNPFARWLAHDQEVRLRRAMERGELLRSETLLVVSYDPEIPFWRALSAGESVRDVVEAHLNRGAVVQRTAQRARMAHAQFERIIDQVVGHMQYARLSPRRLTDDELRELAWETLNPSLSEWKPCPKVRRPDYRDPYAGILSDKHGQQVAREHPEVEALVPVTEREQLVATEWTEGYDWIAVGRDRYYGVLTMRKMPSRVMHGMATVMASLPFESTVVVDIVRMNKQKEMDAQLAEIRLRNSVGNATIGGRDPDSAKLEEAQSAEEARLQLNEASENPFRIRISVVVAGRTPEELDQNCIKADTLLSGMEGMQVLRQQCRVREAWAATWAFAPATNYSMCRGVTSEVADLLPVFSTWEGSERPVTLAVSRGGRLIKHDPFPSNTLNRNSAVFGTSGTGKSLNVQVLDVQPHAALAGTEALIIDSEASFKYTTLLLGGIYVRLGPSCRENVNPFDLHPEFFSFDEERRRAEIARKQSFIKVLVSEMTRLSDPVQVQTAESVVSEVVGDVYAEALSAGEEGYRAPLLRDVVARLDQYRNPRLPHAEQVAANLVLLLHPWYTKPDGTDGMYARYVDRHTTFNAQAPIITFDIMDIKGDPPLMRVMSLILFLGLYYNRLNQTDEKERKAYLDEAWDLIKPNKDGSQTPAGRATEQFWREGRKKYGSCFITQSVSDLINDELGKAILNLSQIRYYLAHEVTGANRDAFRQMDFGARKIDAVFSLTTQHGSHSEVLLREGRHEIVVQVPCVGARYWVSTSDRQDRILRDQYIERYHVRHGKPLEAVFALLGEEYPGGSHNPGHPLPEREALLFIDSFLAYYQRFSALVEAGEPIPVDFQ